MNREERAAIAKRWTSMYDRGAHDYTDAGCRVLAEHGFRDVNDLLDTIDRLEGLLKPLVEREPIADWKDHDHTVCAYCLMVSPADYEQVHDDTCPWLIAKQSME